MHCGGCLVCQSDNGDSGSTSTHQFRATPYPSLNFLNMRGRQSRHKNAEGVVHAEMEAGHPQCLSRFMPKVLHWASLQGIKYIYTNDKAALTVPGDGYGLLAAAKADKVAATRILDVHPTSAVLKNQTIYADCLDNASDYGYGVLPSSDNGTGVATPLPMVMWTWRWPCMWPICNGANSCSMITATRCLMPAENPSPIKEMINVRGLVARSTCFPTENPQRSNRRYRFWFTLAVVTPGWNRPHGP